MKITLLLGSFLLLLFCVTPVQVSAQSFDSAVELHGYAWSSNVGWISFNCDNESTCGSVDYKVELNPNNTLTGYAWSSNIGWIKFGGLSGAPRSGGQARLSNDRSRVVGWARACSATASGDCTGSLHTNGGGWDGWISLNQSNYGTGPNYGVTVGNGRLNGYAWGSEVIGWVSFSGTGYRVTFTKPCTPDLICNAANTSYVTRNQWCDDSARTSCQSNEYCFDSTGCEVVNIPNTISVSSSLVRPGSTVELNWSVESSAARSCTVTGNNGDRWTGLSDSGPTVTSKLNRQSTVFTLRCVPPWGGAAVELDSVEVKLVPTMI